MSQWKHLAAQLAGGLAVGLPTYYLVYEVLPPPPIWLSIIILLVVFGGIAFLAAKDLRAWWRSIDPD